jgi:hypothetical protein
MYVRINRVVVVLDFHHGSMIYPCTEPDINLRPSVSRKRIKRHFLICRRPNINLGEADPGGLGECPQKINSSNRALLSQNKEAENV